jgi:hypothetical protein
MGSALGVALTTSETALSGTSLTGTPIRVAYEVAWMQLEVSRASRASSPGLGVTRWVWSSVKSGSRDFGSLNVELPLP